LGKPDFMRVPIPAAKITVESFMVMPPEKQNRKAMPGSGSLCHYSQGTLR
jgi:hypothetical protein